MLLLESATDPEWLARVQGGIDELLVDHAHCEKKAASTALSLIFKYTEQAVLLEPLSALAREELAHFEQVLGVIRSRGRELTRLRPSPYAGKLLSACRAKEPGRLLDVLLASALIEARSAERMAILAQGVAEPRLAALYRELLASEVRHHSAYLGLARSIFDPAEVAARLGALARHEAEVVRSMPPWVRMHC